MIYQFGKTYHKVSIV